MYHRVANLQNDPWNLAVDTAHFEEQIKYLKKNHSIVGLADLQQSLREGSKKSIALTFDDGYADNFLAAKPILESHNVPATFFICTRFISSGHQFWWDTLQQIFIDLPLLPAELLLPVSEKIFSIDLSGEEQLSEEQVVKYARWRYPEQPPGKRGQAYMLVWQALKNADVDEQDKVLNWLREWSGYRAENNDQYRVMTEKELKQLSANPLFSIGAHTVNHLPLNRYSPDQQRKEISESKQYLEQITGQVISTFAFPFGDYDDKTCEILRSEHFSLAVSTADNLVHSDTNPFQLGRYLVENLPGKELIGELKKRLQTS